MIGNTLIVRILLCLVFIVSQLSSVFAINRDSIGGLGASLIQKNGYTIIDNILEGGAISKNGTLNISDTIFFIGQSVDSMKSVFGLPLTEVCIMLTGEIGSFVYLDCGHNYIHKIRRDTLPYNHIVYDTINIKNDTFSFYGRLEFFQKDLVYYGKLLTRELETYNGYFQTMPYKSYDNCYARKVKMNGDTTFINGTRHETLKNNSYKISGHDTKAYYNDTKIYDSEKKVWKNLYNGTEYYNSDSIIEVYNEEISLFTSFWIFVRAYTITFILIVLLLYPFFKNFEHFWDLGLKKAFVVSLVLTLVYFFIFDTFEQNQFKFPAHTLMWLSLIITLLLHKHKPLLRKLNTIVFAIMMVFWIIFQTMYLDEIIIKNNHEIKVSWRKGTDLIKRIFIKKIISEMIVCECVDTKNTNFDIFVSPTFVSQSFYDLIFDFSLYDAIMGSSKATNVSYRDAKQIIKIIKQISNIDFDIITYAEYQQVFHDNSIGEEFTSSYYIQPCISLSANNLLYSYNNVVVCPTTKNGKNIKDTETDRAPFRLVYRTNNKKRKFDILGYKRSEIIDNNIPNCIKLLSLNGVDIQKMYDYETFYEKLIESRFNKKEIEVLDTINNTNMTLTMPKGYELFDFMPLFYE